ncbi:MAG: type IX secretion system protein PorQ [Bacteroidales bacterium]|nr:type IX secretion system protein PorQ [Bacteroidales bacterium]MCB8998655.1 type IX secretion system protein PorQ [Bacteroidales bacterium]MCB9012477.1 type IX secretion system protein PorQ [Bacteroidales bacterium]
MRRVNLVFLLFICLTTAVSGQIGGHYTYGFLNLTNSARVASLGGKSVALSGDDLNLPFHNPSLLNASMDQHMVLNYVGYFAGIKYGYASYAKDFARKGTVALGMHYSNYGTFTGANEIGERTGDFKAAEYALNIIYSRKIDSLISVGLNVKPVYSNLETYNSFGMAADLGVTYFNPEKLFTAALVLKNMGTQLVKYYHGADRENLPFEIQAGISQKLMHAPFRFSLTLQQLQKFDLSYVSTIDNSTIFDPQSGNNIGKNKAEIFADKLMRHAILGMEFMPGENFYVSLGYNYQRRQELKIPIQTGMVGFSWGFGLKIKKYRFSYGRATYHLAGASNHFSLSVDLSEFYKKSQSTITD